MKKILAVFLMCALLTASGCQIGGRDIVVTGVAGNRQVFTIGKKSCDIREAKVYLTNYRNIYGTAYGINLWEHDFGNSSLEDYVRGVALDELTKIFCMELLAEQNEVTLTDEENKKVREAAKEYYGSLTDAEVAYMDVSERDIADYYGRYALAQKIYNYLTESVNEEVSDDEARVMEIMQIYVTSAKSAAEVAAKLAAEEEFAAVAKNYNEKPAISVTVSRDELPPEVEEAAFELDNNQVSGKIEASDGYYFIKCLNKYNVELTEANKSKIVEKRENEVFDNAYDKLLVSLTSSFYEEAWNAIDLALDEELNTNSFFAVFEQYFAEI